MISQPGNAFILLETEEHEAVNALWRAGKESGKSLVERYQAICHAVMFPIATRLRCTVNAVPPVHQDLVAQAVLANAITYNELNGSPFGELVATVYYRGGGSEYLESYGRLCFCSAYHVRRPRAGALHSSSCSALWEAYCHAADVVLSRAKAPAGMPADLCIVDLTPAQEGGELAPPLPDRSLQQLIAAALGIDEGMVREAWVTLGLGPAAEKSVTASSCMGAVEALVGSQLIRHSSLFHKTVLVIVDDAAPAAVTASFALHLRKWTSGPVQIIGVRWHEGKSWRVVVKPAC